jgi:hypothetical protein
MIGLRATSVRWLPPSAAASARSHHHVSILGISH